MATQNIEIVPAAFKSQQLPFFFGGSQVPIALIDLTQQSKMTPKKKQKITHYYKKKPKVIDLVSSSDSDSDEELSPHIRNFRYGKKKPPVVFKN
jgi:hypothetical protein